MNQGAIKKTIKYITAAVVFFFVLEISARVDDYVSYDAPLFGEYSNELLRKYDADGIRCNIPNARFEKWQNNSAGFRGPEISKVAPETMTRIFCMGTSESYGLYETEGKEWPAQLREKLNPFDTFEVINASTVGLPLQQYGQYLEKYVYQYDPDVVILLVNPVSYMARLERMKKAKNRDSLPASDSVTVQQSGIAVLGLSPSLRILPKTKQMIKGFLPAEMVSWYQERDVSDKISDMEMRYLRGEKPYEQVAKENLDRYRADVDSLVSSLKAKQIKVILTTYPRLMAVDNLQKYPIIFNEARRFSVEYSLQGMLDVSVKSDSLMNLIATEQQIPLVDLHSLVPKSTDYFADMVHLTDSGAAVVAEAIAHSLLSTEK